MQNLKSKNLANHRSFRLGVTGGIGSGKSTFAAMLVEAGFKLVDADALSRSMTAAGGAAIEPIRTTFGSELIDFSGALDRNKMRSLVFANPQAKQQLEAIIHPLVGQAIEGAIAEVERQGAPAVALDIPLLAESNHWPNKLDAVLVVDCLETTQLERVQQRSGLDVAAVQAIIASQSSRQKRRAVADFVVYNEGLELSQLRATADQVAGWLGL